jgi:hypothetical protein
MLEHAKDLATAFYTANDGKFFGVDYLPYVMRADALVQGKVSEDARAAGFLREVLNDGKMTRGGLRESFINTKVPSLVEDLTHAVNPGSWVDARRVYIQKIPRISQEAVVIASAGYVTQMGIMLDGHGKKQDVFRYSKAGRGYELEYLEKTVVALAERTNNPFAVTLHTRLDSIKKAFA